jgi:hypothetical protein
VVISTLPSVSVEDVVEVEALAVVAEVEVVEAEVAVVEEEVVLDVVPGGKTLTKSAWVRNRASAPARARTRGYASRKSGMYMFDP